jgi:putative intracellular protease/amidase
MLRGAEKKKKKKKLKKLPILIVLSSVTDSLQTFPGGVVGSSFVALYEACAPFAAEVCTPDGKVPEIRVLDDATDRWLTANRHVFSNPLRLEDVRASDYSGLAIPDGMGAISDLAQSTALGLLVESFLLANKPIVAVGQGVAALAKAVSSSGDSEWFLSGYNMTATSNFEQARYDWFGELPLIIEDFIKDNGGLYSCSDEDALHIVVDRTLVTGQNANSSALAVKNFTWLLESGKK